MVSFNYIPVSTLRVPGVYVETNNSNANTGQVLQNALICAQMLSSGTATPNVPVAVSGNYNTLFGAGSMASIMCARFLKNNVSTQLYVLPVLDNANAVVATETLTVSGPASAAGTVSLYIAGNLIQATVNTGDTANTIASSIKTAINNTSNLPVTASVSNATVTCTTLNGGVAAGDIDYRLNYAGTLSNQVTPTGVSVQFTQTQAGAVEPVWTTALSNLGSTNFDFIMFPYTDSASLAAIESFLSDASGRWSYQEQLFGHAWTAYRGNLSTLLTLGSTNNNQHLTAIGVNDTPQAMYDVVAACVASASQSLSADPAIPLQNLAVDVLAPPIQSRFSNVNNNSLLYAGITPLKWDISNQGYFVRAVTTYQYNTSGQQDNSYLDVNTMYELMYVERYFINQLSSIYNRVKLLPDGSQIAAGSQATTAQLIKGQCIALYNNLAGLNVVVNPSQFAQQVTATNVGNGTVEIYLPVQLANQLRVIAIQVSFSKP